jgi:hypothetical protein
VKGAAMKKDKLTRRKIKNAEDFAAWVNENIEELEKLPIQDLPQPVIDKVNQDRAARLAPSSIKKH